MCIIGGWRDMDSPTKRKKLKVTKKSQFGGANQVVRLHALLGLTVLDVGPELTLA